MPYYSDNLDDLLAFDGIRSFAGGQASGLQSDLLAENQVRELSNMTLSPKGSLETRRGVLSFSTTATSAEGSIGGMRYYDTAATERLVTVTQGRVYTIDSTGSAKLHPADEIWSQVSRTWGSETQNWADGFSAAIDTPVKMAQFNDKMYMADADGPLYYYDGEIATRQSGKVLKMVT